MKIFLWVVGALTMVGGIYFLFGGVGPTDLFVGCMFLVVGVCALGFGSVLGALANIHDNHVKELRGIAVLLGAGGKRRITAEIPAQVEAITTTEVAK